MKDSATIDTLKVVNVIFAEHLKLVIENPLLKLQIHSLEELNDLYIESDSILKLEINDCKKVISSKELDIFKLKKRLKITYIISSISIVISFFIGLFI